MFSTLSKTEITFFVTFNLSSANAFNLVWSKILSCRKGLRLSHAAPLTEYRASERVCVVTHKVFCSCENDYNKLICYLQIRIFIHLPVYKTFSVLFSRARIHQRFSRTFFNFFFKICKLECNTTSDWLNQSQVVLHSNAAK